MKVPRDLSASALIRVLEKIGYDVTRQKGSHIRLSKTSEGSTHHITIPNHDPIKIGTLNSILKDLSEELKIPKEDNLKIIFLNLEFEAKMRKFEGEAEALTTLILQE